MVTTASSHGVSFRPPVVSERWRLFAAVSSLRPWFPVVVSLGGAHLLGRGLVGLLVSDSCEALAVELVEADAVGLVGDEEVEHGPDE